METLIESRLEWDQVRTKMGNTQVSERYYISVILECIKSLGGEIGTQAGAQQSVDIRDVKWSDNDQLVSYECKKMNKGSNFHLNDTFLKPEIWYIFIYADIEKVRIVKGSELIEKTLNNDSNQPRRHLGTMAKCILDMLSTEITHDQVRKLFSETLLFLKSCVLSGIISYFDFGELFKQTINFGYFSSRPRPNWTVKVPYF